MTEIVRFLVEEGMSYLKITGGEPMVRKGKDKDIVDLVQKLSIIPNVRKISLISRHPRAGELAEELMEAGLTLLNFSLDSLEPITWSKIVQLPLSIGSRWHTRLLDAIIGASLSGTPIQINSVILRDINHKQIPELIIFAGKIKATLKLEELIRDVPGYCADSASSFAFKRYYSLDDAAKCFPSAVLQKDVAYKPGRLGHPMPRFFLENEAVVLIKTLKAGAWYSNSCWNCRFFPCDDAVMALRLTPDGKLQFCLKRADTMVNLHQLVSSNADKETIRKVVKEALQFYQNVTFLSYGSIRNLQAEKSELYAEKRGV
jgi:cyclic pyranopterin phosphate synthase